MKGNRPAEIFGYHVSNKSKRAQIARQQHYCPFMNKPCDKDSRMIDYPFGVCSVNHGDKLCTICPHRFEEQGKVEGVPRILENIALHYFGDLNNVLLFREVNLPHVGRIDYVLVRHKPMRAEVEDFVAAEFQTDSTTSTGQLVRGMQDFVAGENVRERHYPFNMNTYDTIKRSITQLFNKGIVYETWGTKCYWVIQEYIYANLVRRYGFKAGGFSPQHALRFALCELAQTGNALTLTPTRFISTTVDEVYQAMRDNPHLPDKNQFIKALNVRLRAQLEIG